MGHPMEQFFTIDIALSAQTWRSVLMMGFGGMLPGKCAVGADLTSVSVISLTAMVAQLSKWIPVCLPDLMIDREQCFGIGTLA